MNEIKENREVRARRHFNAEFKKAAVENYKKNGSNLSRTAQELGINHWTLREWVELDRKASAPVKRERSKEEMEEEIRVLKKDLERVTEQRDILKKSLGILSAT